MWPKPPSDPEEAFFASLLRHNDRRSEVSRDEYDATFGPGAFNRDYPTILKPVWERIELGVGRGVQLPTPLTLDTFKTWLKEADKAAAHPHAEEWAAVGRDLGPRPGDPDEARIYNQLFTRRLERLLNQKLDTGRTTLRTDTGQDRLEVRTLRTFLDTDLPQREDRVQGLLPAQGLVGLIGAPKTGKSLYAFQLALSITTGAPFLDRAVSQAPVILIEEEGALVKLQYRLRAQAEAIGADSADDLHLVLRQQFSLADDQDVEELRRRLRSTGAKVVIIGPLAQVGGLTSENDSPEMNRVMRVLNGLATEFGALVVLIHHRRKDGKDGPPKGVSEFFESARGSNAYVAALDVAVGLHRQQEADTGEMYILSRDGPAFREFYRFDRETLLVHPTDAPPRKLTKAPLEDVLRCVNEAQDGVTAQQVATRFGIDKKTAQSRLEALVADHTAYPIKGPRGAVRYIGTTNGLLNQAEGDNP